jgi:hypothetical protein
MRTTNIRLGLVGGLAILLAASCGGKATTSGGGSSGSGGGSDSGGSAGAGGGSGSGGSSGGSAGTVGAGGGSGNNGSSGSTGSGGSSGSAPFDGGSCTYSVATSKWDCGGMVLLSCSQGIGPGSKCFPTSADPPGCLVCESDGTGYELKCDVKVPPMGADHLIEVATFTCKH